MRQPLTVAVVQPAWVGADVIANAQVHADAVTETGARLVVFPELSLTGYDLCALPISPDDLRLELIQEACRRTGAVALVGAPVRIEERRDYIATLAVTGDRAMVVYRRMWLRGAEYDRFTPGEKPEVLTVDGWRIGLAISYDAAVAQHAADTAALGMDAYVASAVYGDSPEAHARRDLVMREGATTHATWMVLSTAAGPSGSYACTSGGSGIWAPTGALVSQAGAEPGEVAVATLR